jgi:hypothetical protein
MDPKSLALARLIAKVRAMVETVDSHDSHALLALDDDPHPPSSINAAADDLHSALIDYLAAANA